MHQDKNINYLIFQKVVSSLFMPVAGPGLCVASNKFEDLWSFDLEYADLDQNAYSKIKFLS